MRMRLQFSISVVKTTSTTRSKSSR
ncbi:hypothetical protein NC652_011554 [Populus alba x Populus x berolinensis]|nr:hypothetical protein NC652_011554 [Populus alba x Populus x berolinensis]